MEGMGNGIPTDRIGAGGRAAGRAGRRFDQWAPLLAAALLVGCVGIAAQPAAAATGKSKKPKKSEAWISAKSMVVFPLSEDGIPTTGARLSHSIVDASRDSFKLADVPDAVQVEGGRYPAVDWMRIDLSNAVVKPNHQSAGIGDVRPTAHALAARHFEFSAEPLISSKGRIFIHVTGTDVRLDLQHDKAGRPLLMLADAKEGALHFEAGREDLERIIVASARESAAGHGLGVRSVRVNLTNIGPRTLIAEMHVSALFGFVPAGLNFTARVDVDDKMNAKMTNLTVDGDEVLGPLIVNFIRPGLTKYNGMTRPLISFPSPDVHLKSVQLLGGDRIRLDATFGRLDEEIKPQMGRR